MVEGIHGESLLGEVGFELGVLEAFLEGNALDRIEDGCSINELGREEDVPVTAFPQLAGCLEVPFL